MLLNVIYLDCDGWCDVDDSGVLGLLPDPGVLQLDQSGLGEPQGVTTQGHLLDLDHLRVPKINIYLDFQSYLIFPILKHVLAVLEPDIMFKKVNLLSSSSLKIGGSK